MQKALTIEYAQSKINSLNLDFIILEYNQKGKKSKFKHSCNFIFNMKLYHLLDRKKCPNCHGKVRNKEKFQEKSNEVHNKEYEILEFENGNKPVTIKHRICGTIFKQRGCNHLRGDRCSKCYGNKKLSKEEIVERSNKTWNSEYELLSDEVNYSKKALIRHKKCGYEYEQLIYSHLTGAGCPKCAGNKPLTKEYVQEKSNKVHSNEYEILSNPKGAFSKINIKHKKCGYEYEQVVSTHLSGCGCSRCNTSKGELFVESILKEESIIYCTQKTFDDCKYINKLKYDFFLPELNTCIEFDGEQHFKPIRWFGGKKAYIIQKIKDDIKNKYCLNNNIKIIRFKFDDDFDKIRCAIKNLLN